MIIGTGLPIFHTQTQDIKPQLTGSSIHSHTTGSHATGSLANMVITSEEIEWYTAAFGSCSPVDGFITGDFIIKM